jgi:hypothetical protein
MGVAKIVGRAIKGLKKDQLEICLGLSNVLKLLHFSEKELSDLTLAVATINGWNRLLISSRAVPGQYQPAKPSRVEKSA